MVLNVEGTAPAKNSESGAPGALRAVRDMRTNGVFDIWKWHIEMDTGAGIHPQKHAQSEWVNCDIEMPALWLHASSFENSINTEWEAYVIVEYDWVSKDISDIAALQLLWGLDPIDFDGVGADQTG